MSSRATIAARIATPSIIARLWRGSNLVQKERRPPQPGKVGRPKEQRSKGDRIDTFKSKNLDRSPPDSCLNIPEAIQKRLVMLSEKTKGFLSSTHLKSPCELSSSVPFHLVRMYHSHLSWAYSGASPEPKESVGLVTNAIFTATVSLSDQDQFALRVDPSCIQ